MECPKCHSIVDDSQKICPHCNKVLLLECPNCHSLSESAVCSKCGYTILVKCAKCSKINPFDKAFCTKCGFSISTSLAYQECETDEFASVVIRFNSLKRIRKLLKSQELYVKFLYKIKNLLQAQIKGLDCKIINFDDIYEINFNKELSLATSANKAVRLAIKIVNAFIELNSKLMEELSIPINLNLSICKKRAENLQNLSLKENNVKLLNIKKDDKKYLRGFQIILDQHIRDQVNKDFSTDSLYSVENDGISTMFYEIILDKYIIPPNENLDTIAPIIPERVNKKAPKQEHKEDFYQFKVFDINAKCKFKKSDAVQIWDILSTIDFSKGGKIVSIRSEKDFSIDLNELELYFKSQDFKLAKVSCTEELSYKPWGVLQEIFRSYFNLPLSKTRKALSNIEEKVFNFHKPLFDLFFNKPIKAMTPEDARYGYIEQWNKFLKVLKDTVIIIEGFENIDDTTLQVLELYFDKFKNIRPNFVFINTDDISVHSKIKEFLKTDCYTEILLKPTSLDNCLSTLKLDASDFIQSFYYEKISDNFKGSYLYFKNAIQYLKDSGVIIEFENKLILKDKKAVVLPNDLFGLYKSRIKSLGNNFDLSLMLAYSTILGPNLDFSALNTLEIKDIDKNAQKLQDIGLATINCGSLIINNFNLVSEVLKSSLKKEIEQYLAKNIMGKFAKTIDDTIVAFSMGKLDAFKEEYLTLWKISQFALKTGDYDAYLKNCLGFLTLIEQVGENIPAETINENKKEVYNNILMTLYAYSPSKIYFIENSLLLDAINENDSDKIVKLSNLMLQGALISSNYTDAQGLLHNILSRMPNPTLLVNGEVNTKFLLLALVNIEILYNIGKYKECVEIAEEILSVLSIDVINKAKPASFSTNLFVSHIAETLRLVAFAKIYILDDDLEDFFNLIKEKLNIELAEKDCVIAIKDFLADKVYSSPNIEEISAFSKIIYLILHELENLKADYKSFAQNIYQAKLLASEIHQKEIELLCDLLIAYAYSKTNTVKKALAIYDDVINISEKSAIFNTLALSKYLKAKLLIELNEDTSALLLINDMLAIIQRNDNQSKIMYVLFEKLYIEAFEKENSSSIDIETEKLKLEEYSTSLSRLLN